MRLERIKKIAVLRANALGDVILSLPACEALKKAYPEAEIVLLGRSSHLNFYQGLVGPFDRIIPLPSSLKFDESLFDRNSNNKAIVNLLREEKFDLGVQLHGGGRFSNAFLLMIGARITAGARTPDAPLLDINLPYQQFNHETLRQLDIVEQLGGVIETRAPKLLVNEEVLESSRSKLLDLFEVKFLEKRPVLINPGATDPKRRWPASKFAILCEALREQGHKVLLNIGPNESELIAQIKCGLSSSHDVFFITPSLQELSGILVNCSLVISNDTGTLHLGMALGVPSVALFWHRNLVNYGPIISTSNRVLVSWQMNCPICHINCCVEKCDHEASLVSSICEKKVLEAACELLGTSL
jgi:ADP-heptose:LPS heptosyltransferase